MRRMLVRLLASFLTLALAIVVLELASLGLYRLVAHEPFSFGRVAAQRSDAIAEWTRYATPPAPSAGVTFPPDADGVEGQLVRTQGETVPHPFLGYVANPENPGPAASQGNGGLILGEHGFLLLPKPRGEGPFWTVAVFGGSVAAWLSVDGRAALADAIARTPLPRGRRVRVRSFSEAGYKQPQMALALAYLLALGERFDAVVELDGVNDVSISYIEHRWRHKFPFYPREWEHLVSSAGDAQEHLRIGRIAMLLQRRASLARAFGRRRLRWSVTASLVWRQLDRAVFAQLSAARATEAAQGNLVLGYRERGPMRVYPTDDDLFRDLGRVWANSSRQMHALCAGAGIRYHHFLQPNQYVAGSKPMGADERKAAIRDDAPFRPMIERGYPTFQAEGRALAQEGVAFTDLTRVFADVPEPIYVDDCCHVNARGSEIMAREIGARLAEP